MREQTARGSRSSRARQVSEILSGGGCRGKWRVLVFHPAHSLPPSPLPLTSCCRRAPVVHSGTGKTTTLKALLNALHQREYNRYYEQLLKLARVPPEDTPAAWDKLSECAAPSARAWGPCLVSPARRAG